MIRRTIRRIFTVAPVVLVTYSLAVVSYYRPAKAQVGQLAEEVWKTAEKVKNLDEDLTGRVTRNEATAQALQGKVDSLSDRLSHVETTVESINWLTRGSVAGIVMILIERAFGLAGKKRRNEGDADSGD